MIHASTKPAKPRRCHKKLIHWGEQQEPIRTMLLTSTRVVPNAPIDDLSDYDVVLVVEDIHPFHRERSWLNDFGEVLVAYWDPIYSDPYTGTDKFGNVIQYIDGLKIDFTLYPVSWLRAVVQAPTLPAELDAGYRVLLDKDGLRLSTRTGPAGNSICTKYAASLRRNNLMEHPVQDGSTQRLLDGVRRVLTLCWSTTGRTFLNHHPLSGW